MTPFCENYFSLENHSENEVTAPPHLAHFLGLLKALTRLPPPLAIGQGRDWNSSLDSLLQTPV